VKSWSKLLKRLWQRRLYFSVVVVFSTAIALVLRVIAVGEFKAIR